MDAPITHHQAQPGGSTGMPAAAPLASVAHHKRTGVHTALRAPPDFCSPQAAHSGADRSGLILLPHTHHAAGPTDRPARPARARPRGPASQGMLTSLALPGLNWVPPKSSQRDAAGDAPLHTRARQSRKAPYTPHSPQWTRPQPPGQLHLPKKSNTEILPGVLRLDGAAPAPRRSPPHPPAVQGLGQTPCAARSHAARLLNHELRAGPAQRMSGHSARRTRVRQRLPFGRVQRLPGGQGYRGHSDQAEIEQQNAAAGIVRGE